MPELGGWGLLLACQLFVTHSSLPPLVSLLPQTTWGRKLEVRRFRERESQNVSRAERLSYFVEEKSEGKSESERRFTQNLRTSAALKT